MAEHTPGPWVWSGNANVNDLYLESSGLHHRTVLTFERWGMQRAQPAFCVGEELVPAADLLKFVVGNRDVRGLKQARAKGSGVYRFNVCDIDHPDARLIAAAPDLLAALSELVEIGRRDNLTDPCMCATDDHREEAWNNACAALAKAKGEPTP